MPAAVAHAARYGTLEVTASGLPGQAPSFVHPIPLTQAAIHWACQSFGAPSYGIDLGHEAVTMVSYRATALELCLSSGVPTPQRREVGDAFDASETGNISYWLGMVAATLAADQILGVRYLMHTASLLKSKHLIRMQQSSKVLADLVGWDHRGKVHVIEAKGRKIKPRDKDRDHWRTQARTVKSLCGKAPTTQSYVVTWGRKRVISELVDPPEPEPDSIDLKVDGGFERLESLFRAPFVGYLKTRPLARTELIDSRSDLPAARLPSSGQERSEVYLSLMDSPPDPDQKRETLGYQDEGRSYFGRNGLACHIREEDRRMPQ